MLRFIKFIFCAVMVSQQQENCSHYIATSVTGLVKNYQQVAIAIFQCEYIIFGGELQAD